jgi:hypothetical protein
MSTPALLYVIFLGKVPSRSSQNRNLFLMENSWIVNREKFFVYPFFIAVSRIWGPAWPGEGGEDSRRKKDRLQNKSGI